ncbi:hypothetical protein CPS_3472 [Colwellia psychrerythraea 34H]|uniref:Uncharacterized protein n=1 Tax=Colwellia psychrerythraea (strain 34H / ATCC BAA-681) TaxID=167879 RepID=Q47YH4_COLP3|nr:hypothetical protein CPS_3472 [Colwellia psychrerythraea 34H]
MPIIIAESLFKNDNEDGLSVIKLIFLLCKAIFNR